MTMTSLTPQDFIQNVLIDQIEDIHKNHAYISFYLMAIGIEFLSTEEDWNKQGQSKIDFEYAINNLDSFKDYIPFLSTHFLWTSLRNGFLHSFVPKNTITLSSGDEMPHLEEHNNKVNLKCENFYNDFKNACHEILSMTTFPSNKMTSPLLYVPGVSTNISFSGTTY